MKSIRTLLLLTAAAAVSAPVGMWVDSIELTPPLSGMPPPPLCGV